MGEWYRFPTTWLSGNIDFKGEWEYSCGILLIIFFFRFFFLTLGWCSYILVLLSCSSDLSLFLFFPFNSRFSFGPCGRSVDEVFSEAVSDAAHNPELERAFNN